MEWAIIFLALLLGIILAAQKNVPQRHNRPTHHIPSQNVRPPLLQPIRNDNQDLPRGFDFTILPTRFPNAPNSFPATNPPFPRPNFITQQPMRNASARERVLVENWKKSVIGLIKLAEQNLRIAKQYLLLASYKAAVESATTSVENIARALIHCYGGKPDSDMGQEEALSLLCGRFEEKERKEFENAIRHVAQVHAYVLTSKRGLEITETQAKQAFDSALTVASLFKRILVSRFAGEIPELGEACPKCHSLDIATWSFNDHKANLECDNCHHKWTEDRN